MSQAAADELQRRLESFTVKIIELVVHLPKTAAGRHVSSQILRSGTSPALNYGEARGQRAVPTSYINSESPSKNSMRQGIWLLIVLEARMVPSVLIENLIKENRELACILGA